MAAEWATAVVGAHTQTHRHTHCWTHALLLAPLHQRAFPIIILVVGTVGRSLQSWRDAEVILGFDQRPAGARVCFGCKPTHPLEDSGSFYLIFYILP